MRSRVGGGFVLALATSAALAVPGGGCLTDFPEPIASTTSSSATNASSSSSAGGAGGSVSMTCPEGFGDCNAAPGCETELVVDGACGACGRTCIDGLACTRGLCPAHEVAEASQVFEVMVDATDVYWTDYQEGQVARRSRDGSGSTTILYDGDVNQAWHAALGATDVFVSTRNGGRLVRVPKDASGAVTMVHAIEASGSPAASRKMYGVAASPDDDFILLGIANGTAADVFAIDNPGLQDLELEPDQDLPAPGMRRLVLPDPKPVRPYRMRRSGGFAYFTDLMGAGVWRLEAEVQAGAPHVGGIEVIAQGVDARDPGGPDEAVYNTWLDGDHGELRRRGGRPSDVAPNELRWSGEACTDVVTKDAFVYWIAQPGGGGGRVLRQGHDDAAGRALTIYQAEPGQHLQGLAVDDEAAYFGWWTDADGTGGAGATGKILRVTR